jgi:hypothetical protein
MFISVYGLIWRLFTQSLWKSNLKARDLPNHLSRCIVCESPTPVFAIHSQSQRVHHVLMDMIFYGVDIVLYLHLLMVVVVINRVHNHLVHVLKNIMIDHIFIAKIIHSAIIILI